MLLPGKNVDRLVLQVMPRTNYMHACKSYLNTRLIQEHVLILMFAKHIAALAKFGCGVSPLRLETGRYEN